MQSLNPILRLVPILLTSLMTISMCDAGAVGQATKPPTPPLNLPDPTPRPPDLERKYSTDPAEAARQQQQAALKAAQIRQQVMTATDKLVSLTQELEADVAKREHGTAMTPQVVKVEQIEKLAKTVKDRTKAQ
jgi:hypothetical protein